MPHEFQKIRCQRCRAANPYGQELCERCGTRLMLVVEPASLRFESSSAAGDSQHDALMLERMTVLETALTKFAEKLERGFHLMLQHAENLQHEHQIVDSLVTLLIEAGVITRGALKELCRANVARGETARHEYERCARLNRAVIEESPEEGREALAAHLEEGLALYEKGEEDGALLALERAAGLAPSSHALQAFVGGQFFRRGKSALARSYLTRALVSNPQDAGSQLLLGLTLADEGTELEAARTLISTALKRGGKSFAGHYALGRLAVLAGDWAGADAEFRRAHAARASAESHFLLALASLKLSRPRLALRHARAALATDENYAAPYLLLGLLHRREKDHARAREAFAHAELLGGGGAAGGDRKRAARESEPALMRRVFGAARLKGSGLLTGGDERLARLLRDDALAFAAAAR
ncbi:MAG: tetratricopeptide repeat protein [Pyrinomonadaceae bacterium]